MSATHKLPLATTGSTGNNTHTSCGLHPAADKVCAALVIEAVGGGPTITIKIQGSLDDSTVADGSANWFDLPFITDTNDTVAASLTKTATGTYPMWVSQAHSRFIKKIRAVTSSNTNVTYRVDGFEQFHN